MFYGGESNVAGAIGNLGAYRNQIAGNPFSSDFVIPQQRQQVPGGPQMPPLQQSPTRIFPRNQKGREGAIDVRSAMGLSGMMPMGNAGFFMGPQMGQGIPPGYTNKFVS